MLVDTTYRGKYVGRRNCYFANFRKKSCHNDIVAFRLDLLSNIFFPSQTISESQLHNIPQRVKPAACQDCR